MPAPWPTVARRLAALEARQYAAIGRWLRRRPDVPPEAVALPYAQLVVPVLWLFVLGSAVEVAVFHVLLGRWPWVQWPVTALGLWALLWMVGLLAAYRTSPHVLAHDRLLLRAGAVAEVVVPVDLIGEVAVRERDLSSSARLTEVVSGGDETWLGVGVSGRTNLQLSLREPLTLPHPGLLDAGEVTVTALGCWVDDPRAAGRLMRPRGGGAA